MDSGQKRPAPPTGMPDEEITGAIDQATVVSCPARPDRDERPSGRWTLCQTRC